MKYTINGDKIKSMSVNTMTGETIIVLKPSGSVVIDKAGPLYYPVSKPYAIHIEPIPRDLFDEIEEEEEPRIYGF